MSVLDRDALQASPLSDLHTIASELSIDGYRRLRKADLIDRILGLRDDAGGVEEAEPAPQDAGGDEEQPARRRRGRRGGRGRTGGREEGSGDAGEDLADEAATPPATEEAPEKTAPAPRRSGTREQATSGTSRARDREEAAPVGRRAKPREEDRAGARGAETESRQDDEPVEGVVELLPGGSGFVRVSPPEPSDEDVYISAAQVKRCELVSGDRVSGPRRAPRRSERFASLVRVDTINGQAASELTSGGRFDDLPAAFPSERFRLGSDDATVKAIEFLTPLGKGSRVTITGAPRAGKSEALRRLAYALRTQEDLQVSVALAGVRPEEISEWNAGELAPAAAISFAVSPDAQDNAVELVVDQARRIAARGAHAVVLVDTLDGLHPLAARKVLAAARNITGGGSLTVIATASAPIGGETTVIALDVALTSTGRLPALNLTASGSLRPELLVGEAGAEAIARARAEALER